MNVLKLGLLGSLALLGFACSSEEVLQDISSVPGTDGNNGLRIVLQTPSADGVVFKSTRSGSEVVQEEAEWSVKTLNLYLFDKTGEGGTDADYTLYKKTEGITFAPGETAKAGQGISKGDGTYQYTEPITTDMLDKTMKILLVANDKGTGTETVKETKGTTLAEFKKSKATAEVTDKSSADQLVGASSGNGSTGFPMAAVAYRGTTAGQDEAVEITPLGVDMKAELVRNVARVDIFNWVPNMTITGVELTNAASKSYLFSQGDDQTAAPEDASYQTLLPTQAWQTVFAGKGHGFVIPTKPEDTGDDPWVPEEEDFRAKNTLKHVLYMYEQVNDESHCATVKIFYTLTFVGGDRKGFVSVKFEKKEEPQSYIPLTRNTLYTIKLGDGSLVQDEVKVSDIEVEDWVVVDIEGSLTPGKDEVKPVQ